MFSLLLLSGTLAPSRGGAKSVGDVFRNPNARFSLDPNAPSFVNRNAPSFVNPNAQMNGNSAPTNFITPARGNFDLQKFICWLSLYFSSNSS